MDMRRMGVHIGQVNWRAGKLRKVCSECGEPMKLAFDELAIVLDVMPPIYGWDWVCEKGHKEDAGGMNEDHADELSKIFEAE